MRSLLVVYIFILSTAYNTILGQVECIDSTLIDTIYGEVFCYDPEYLSEPDQLFFVCGCDSTTYIDWRCAKFGHGVSSWTNGPCECIDSFFYDENYDLEYFLSDERVIKNQNRVLGCDGKVYLNWEMALRLGAVTSWRYDSIPCKDESFIDSTRDLSLYDDLFDPQVCGCDSVSYNNAYEALFHGGVLFFDEGRCPCYYDELIDSTIQCPDFYDPVCGCDTITYQNECIARYKYGIVDFMEGECVCIDSTLISDSLYIANYDPLLGYRPVCGCDSVTYHNKNIAQYKHGVFKWTNGACKCIDTTFIDMNIECPDHFLPVLGCDGIVYPNSCIARYHFGVMEYNRYGPQCFEESVIDTSVNCYTDLIIDPVCGCDSINYINECAAWYHHGITRWYTGHCVDNYECIDSSLIDPLKTCLEVYYPVCGCDSITYYNECIARYKHGVRDWTSGSCTSFSDNSIFEYASSEIIVYPNPSSGVYYVNTTDTDIISFSIFDVLGNKVENIHLGQDTQQIKFEISNKNSGVFYLHLQTSMGFYVKKLVKIQS